MFPMYNEEDNIHASVERAGAVLGDLVGDDYEIVIVNDASKDRTGEMADELAAADPRIRPVHHEVNQSIGGAIRTGLKHSRGDAVLYVDGDLPCDLDHLREAAPLLEGADIVAGHRVGRRDSVLRWLYSQTYNLLVRCLFGFRVEDVNCPFKLFSPAVVDDLELGSNSGFIDAEILAEATRLGYSIAELPVIYTPRVAGVSTLAHPARILEILQELRQYRRRRRAARRDEEEGE